MLERIHLVLMRPLVHIRWFKSDEPDGTVCGYDASTRETLGPPTCFVCIALDARRIIRSRPWH